MKKTNTKTKRNLKNKKRKTKKVRKNMKRGGEYIDSGTYGAVYANPRMLCEDEELDTPGIYDEVSKIFQYDESAEKENSNVEKLKTFLQERGILEEFKKYAIIPERICNLNRGSLINPPYNTDEWKKNKKGNYNSTFLNENIKNVPTEIPVIGKDGKIINYKSGYNKLIISDEGGDDLYEIIKNIKNYQDFKSFLHKLTTIGKGILILQNNDLIHGDIKVENCIEHEDTFKIIDLSDVRKIRTTKDPAAMPTAFGYHIWPITAFYTYLFEKKVVFNNINDIDAIITVEQIIENYNKRKEYNDDSINYVKSLFYFAFNVSDVVGYTVEQKKKIAYFKMHLIGQKDTVKYEQLERIIIHFNKIFTSTFNDIGEFKMDLFKRIDIYSFGIMILYCIRQYLILSDEMDDIKRENIIKLYEIVFDCCYQKERVANIDKIISNYEILVNSM